MPFGRACSPEAGTGGPALPCGHASPTSAVGAGHLLVFHICDEPLGGKGAAVASGVALAVGALHAALAGVEGVVEEAPVVEEALGAAGKGKSGG